MFAEKKFVTEHTCEVKGQKISYRATVENFFLYDREGEKEASRSVPCCLPIMEDPAAPAP